MNATFIPDETTVPEVASTVTVLTSDIDVCAVESTSLNSSSKDGECIDLTFMQFQPLL